MSAGHYIMVNGHEIFGYCRYHHYMKSIVEIFLPSNSHMVEVGCFLGQSTALTASIILHSGKNIAFDAIDLFNITDYSDAPHEQEIKKYGGDFLEIFTTNLEKSKVRQAVNIIQASSIEASKKYKDNSLHFVMLDASHKTEDVIEDIKAWWPKLKNTGVLAGDDYDWNSVAKAVNTCFTKDEFDVWYDCVWQAQKKED
jgi:predicted O-methyltransferase YrrM